MDIKQALKDAPRNGQEEDSFLKLASEIVSGYVTKNPVKSDDLPKLIQTVHRTLTDLGNLENSRHHKQNPAVAPEKSVTEDYIICLEDGKKLKMLKRHIRSQFGLTPDQYRAKWNLPPSYPMVAPGYAIQRSKLAKKIGLGRKVTYLSRAKG